MKKKKKRFKFKSAAYKSPAPALSSPGDPQYPHFSADDVQGNVGETIELVLRGKVTNKSEHLDGCNLGIEVHEIGSQVGRKKREPSNTADVELERLTSDNEKIEVDVRNPADRSLDQLKATHG